MEELRNIFIKSYNIDFISAVLSNPRIKEGVSKIKVRPVMAGEELCFQFEAFQNNQVFHTNVAAEEAAEYTLARIKEFGQMQFRTKSKDITVLISKKGKVTVKQKPVKGAVKEVDLAHNRTKQYILKEGIPVPFLKDLKVMTEEGKIVRSRFDKFRQINRFLEFIEDILPVLPQDREVTILDFGCGKSYLTFAMYYYLHELKGYDVRIIGLDLKADVIEHCSQLSRKYGYDKLVFQMGDIAEYDELNQVDMVVTLHACDTATDHALAKAVKWNAKVILSVPCCQHELNAQMNCELLAPLFQYGLIQERAAALLTDALRAQYLEQEGYDTQILEFIDMEHTPKNILIRAVRTGKVSNHKEKIEACEAFLQVTPTLKRLLAEL